MQILRRAMRYRMNGNLKKNFIWNMIGMTLNSFNSLFFMIIVTRLNNLKTVVEVSIANPMCDRLLIH